jgi:hypothetical protein
MASYIARRKFLAALGGGVVAWPLAASAEPEGLHDQIWTCDMTKSDAIFGPR